MNLSKPLFIIALLMPPLVCSAQTLTNPAVPKSFAEKYHFNQGQEFPNLFLPEAYRNLAPEQIPANVVEQSRELMEKAFQSILNRTAWKVTLPNEDKAREINLFKYLQASAKQVDSEAKIYPSAGLMRSMFGYIYTQLYNAHQGGEKDSVKVLLSIINSKEAIPSHEIRGVGSDLDILLEASTPEKVNQVKLTTLMIINNDFEKAFGNAHVGQEGLGMARSTFLQGDRVVE